jgi:hypothetical protein
MPVQQIMASSSAFNDPEHEFRQAVAAQLRGLAIGDVAVNPDRVVLQLKELPLRVVVGLNEAGVGRTGWTHWAQLRLEPEDGEGTKELVTLAWRDGGSFERAADPELPLGERGLNAVADVREGEGPYGRRRVAVLDALGGELARAIAAAEGHHGFPRLEERPGWPLARIDPGPRAAAVRVTVNNQVTEVVDGEFTEVVRDVRDRKRGHVTPARDDGSNLIDGEGETVDTFRAVTKRATGRRIPPVEELRVLLTADIVRGMLAEYGAQTLAARAPGAVAFVGEHLGQGVMVAMVAGGYAVETVTSALATGSFLPGGANFAYAFVGPLLIGGAGWLAKTPLKQKMAAWLMGSWALVMAGVIATNPANVSWAQTQFPESEAVSRAKEALEAARGDWKLANEKVTGLDKADVKPAEKVEVKMPPAVSLGKGRRAAELAAKAAQDADKAAADAAVRLAQESNRAAAEREGRAIRERDAAETTLREAARQIVVREAAVKRAILSDPSRIWAGGLLFVFFAAVTFACPYSIGEAMRELSRGNSSSTNKAEARFRARMRVGSLGRSRIQQETFAAELFEKALDKLMAQLRNRRIAVDVLNDVNGADIVAAAAARFDESVNGRPRLTRLFRGSRPAGVAPR